MCLSFDFDALCGTIVESDNPGTISGGEFSAVAIPRILALLARHGVPATFFVPGHTALAYPHLVREIRDAGHEIGHHGWVHENPALFDIEGERRNFERALEALDEVAGVRPVGYRSPSGQFSVNSIGVSLEYGMSYESTFLGSDFHPYYLRVGDRWSTTEPYVFGEPSDLVELPFSWILDDWPHFDFHSASATGLAAPSAVREIWQGEFDYAYANCPGGVYVLCLHPEVIGRGHRIAMFDELVSYMKDQPGVAFERGAEYVERWRAANPLDEWNERGSVHAPHLLP